VLSDISALAYDYKYGYKKLQGNTPTLRNDVLLQVYLRYQNNSIFELIRFKTIDEEFVSSQYKYVIGKVLLSDLLEANLNEREGIFLAEVPEPLESNSVRNKIEILENVS
jgi:homoserine dehydrogenase